LLVGHTAEGTWAANNSAILRASGVSTFTSTSTPPLYANRLTSDGTIAEFRKDGTTVGSIGSEGTWGSGPQFLGSNSRGFIIANPNTSVNEIIPNVDTIGKLGNSSNRWQDLYLSGGVYLGGTGSANYLDDYEEGTFEVTAAPATSGTATINSSYNTLSYTKIGRLVTITGEIRISSFSSAVGNLLLNSLPFTVASLTDVAGRAFTATYFYQGSTAAISAEILYVADNSTQLQIFKNTNTMTNNSEIGISISYVAA